MSDIPVNPATGAPARCQSPAQQSHELPFNIGEMNASEEDVLAALAAVANANGPAGGTSGGRGGGSRGEGVGRESGNATGFESAATAGIVAALQQQRQQSGGGGTYVAVEEDHMSDGTPSKQGKNWACQACGRLFSRRFNCTTHERTHLDLRDYQCQLCPRAFTRRHDLERHINSVHPGHQLVKPSNDDGDALLDPGSHKRRVTNEGGRSGPQAIKIRRVDNGEIISPQNQEAIVQHQQEQQMQQLQAQTQSTAQIGDLSVTVDRSLMDPNHRNKDVPVDDSSFGGSVQTHKPSQQRVPKQPKTDADAGIDRVPNVTEANRESEPVFRYGKKWACGTCGRMFVRRNNCKAHEATHRDVREHLCETCARAFSRRHDLERHIGAVHPGIPLPPRPDGHIPTPKGQGEGSSRKKRHSHGRRGGEEFEIESEEDHDLFRPEENQDDEEEPANGDESAILPTAERSPARARLVRSSRRTADPNNIADTPADAVLILDEYPESNVRGTKESNVRGTEEGRDDISGDLPVIAQTGGGGNSSKAVQHKGISALQATSGSFDQARALEALLASSGASSGSVQVPSSSNAGVPRSANSNIDPTLQALGAHSDYTGVSSGQRKDGAASGTSGAATVAAIAALASGSGYDFTNIPGLNFSK